MKRSIYTIITAILLAIPHQVQARDHKSVSFAWFSMPSSLDVFSVVDTDAQILFSLVYDGLTSLNEQGDPAPNLAAGWETDDAGTTWVFTLKRGVYFHDGRELTAYDVKYNYDRFLGPDAPHVFAAQFDFLESTKVVDKHKIIFHLKYPFSGMLFALNRYIAPMPTATDNAEKPIGTGPFKFVQKTESRLELVRNENYHRGAPEIAGVEFLKYPSYQTAVAALLGDEVDVVVDVAFKDYEHIKNNPKFKIHAYPQPFYYTLLFNNEHPILSSQEIRTAINLAVDRQDLIRTALNNLGTAASGPFGLTSRVHREFTVDAAGKDPDGANKLLDTLGWVDSDNDGARDKDGVSLSFDLLIDRGDPIKERAARRLQWQLLQIGILLTLVEKPVDEFISRSLIPGRYEMALVQFNAAMDPVSSLMLFWHSNAIGKSNLARYSNTTVDALIDSARMENNPVNRYPAYAQIQHHIAYDVPAVFLFYRNNFLAASSYLLIPDIGSGSIFYGVRKWQYVDE